MNLTRTLASEWAAAGVRVNAIAPGIIWSRGLEQYPREHLRLLAERFAASPAARFGTASALAASVVFLIAPAAAFLTGAPIQVSAGTDRAAERTVVTTVLSQLTTRRLPSH